MLTAKILSFPLTGETTPTPKRRGRLPAGMQRSRFDVRPGDLAFITLGPNAGKLVRVTGFSETQVRGDTQLDVESVDGLLVLRNSETNKPTGQGKAGHVSEKALRRTLEEPRPRYALPTWPMRWEQALSSNGGTA